MNPVAGERLRVLFCIKIGRSAQPWFRYVPAGDDWSERYTDDGHPVVSQDALVSLRVADPQNATADRWLPDDVYDKAFDAWQVARNSGYAAWQKLTDPNAFQPDLPLAFRDAYALVFRKAGYLPPPREPLPDIEEHEVRLVTWMAVRGTGGLQ